MKTIIKCTVMILLLLIALPAAGQWNGDSEAFNQNQDKRLWGNYSSEKIDITLSGQPGMRIIIDHQFGDINVIKGANTQVKITGEKRVSARNKDIEEKFLKEMKLRVDERDNSIIITAEYPEQRERERRFQKRIKSFSIMYTIEVPDDIHIEMENSFGDIDLQDLNGEFRIRNGFGKLSAGRLQGDVNLKNQFGALEARDITGDTEINNEHGSLEIRTVNGQLRASNQFGEILVDNVTQDIEIEGAHGKMTVKRIDGKADLKNTFGAINCSDVKGTLEIRNNNAKVDVFNVGKDVTIYNSFGRVKVIETGGNLWIRNNNSNVMVDDVGGDIEINNSFGLVEITKNNGNITVINRHGKITAMDILRNAVEPKTIRLETSFAGIDISLPADISARIEASTSFGSIKSDFPVMTDRTSFNSQRITANLGDEKHSIELEGNNGSIKIMKR